MISGVGRFAGKVAPPLLYRGGASRLTPHYWYEGWLANGGLGISPVGFLRLMSSNRSDGVTSEIRGVPPTGGPSMLNIDRAEAGDLNGIVVTGCDSETAMISLKALVSRSLQCWARSRLMSLCQPGSR